MTNQVPSLRQRLARIEKRPKPVFIERWHDFAGVRRVPALIAELDEIIEGIERGGGVSEAHYRAGIDRNGDPLLEQQGIMHLHLGGKESDVLVFLVQYPNRVVLLESNTQVHFRTQPAGKNILALTQSWLGNMEREMQHAAEQARTAAAEGERQEAEVRRARIAAAIAAFRAKTGLNER